MPFFSTCHFVIDKKDISHSEPNIIITKMTLNNFDVYSYILL